MRQAGSICAGAIDGTANLCDSWNMRHEALSGSLSDVGKDRAHAAASGVSVGTQGVGAARRRRGGLCEELGGDGQEGSAKGCRSRIQLSCDLCWPVPALSMAMSAAVSAIA